MTMCRRTPSAAWFTTPSALVPLGHGGDAVNCRDGGFLSFYHLKKYQACKAEHPGQSESIIQSEERFDKGMWEDSLHVDIKYSVFQNHNGDSRHILLCWPLLHHRGG